MARQEWLGYLSWDMLWNCAAGTERQGNARVGEQRKVRQGKEMYVKSRFCKERFGVAGGDRCFMVRPVPDLYGQVRQAGMGLLLIGIAS